MRLKQAPVSSYSLHSTPSNSPLLSQRQSTAVTSLPILGSHKDLLHKDIMHKALNVPPTPSPDSAIHSAYSVFSSPNQSPLTQRHITLTPNLSRNNSDASHSSCYSCSSVSVSVSPTQQFSPTHSPIQVSVWIRRSLSAHCKQIVVVVEVSVLALFLSDCCAKMNYSLLLDRYTCLTFVTANTRVHMYDGRNAAVS